MAIIVSDMRKAFRGVTVLDSTSFMVADGEFFSLLGPEKSGKSTIISCLSTLTNPDSGLVEINGRNLGVADESIAADIGVVFESIFLDLKLTVRGNISFHAALHGLSDEGLEDLAARLDITSVLNRRLGTLSIGEQRRVDFARALVHSPGVLLLDEPVKGLDPHSTEVIWQVIEEELERGTTILMATEDASTAARADRMGILIAGQVVATGTSSSLVEEYCPSVLLLRLADPRAAKQELESVGIPMPAPGANGEVELQLDSATARDVIALLGDQVLSFEFHNGDLEEVVRVLSGKGVPVRTDNVRNHDEVDEADNPIDEAGETEEVTEIEGVEGEYWDDRVIAPVWSNDWEAANVPEGETERWDDDIYIRNDVHHLDRTPFVDGDDEDKLPVKDEIPSPVILPGAGSPSDTEELDDDFSDDPFDEAVNSSWEEGLDEDEWEEPVQHWRKARGFADTGRGAYQLDDPVMDDDESVQRTDDFYEDDSVYDRDPGYGQDGDDPDSVDDQDFEDDHIFGDDQIFEDDQGVELGADFDQDSTYDRDADDRDAYYRDADGRDSADRRPTDRDSADRGVTHHTLTPVDPFMDDPDAGPIENHDYLAELNEIIREEQRRVKEADQLDRLAIVSRLLEDAVLTDPLPPFDETFPIDRLPFARDIAAPKPRRTTWYEEMRRPINEEMAKQARIKLAVEKRIEEARRRRDERGGVA